MEEQPAIDPPVTTAGIGYMSGIWINIISFQVVWFASVLYGNGPALIATSIALLIHARCLVRNQREWILIPIIVLFGFIWDGLMSYFLILVFNPTPVLFVPVWLLCLWGVFGSTLAHAFSWLKDRLLISALLGSIFGPLSYWGGAQLSSTEIGNPVNRSLLVLSLGWMMIMPAAVWLTNKVVRN